MASKGRLSRMPTVNSLPGIYSSIIILRSYLKASSIASFRSPGLSTIESPMLEPPDTGLITAG